MNTLLRLLLFLACAATAAAQFAPYVRNQYSTSTNGQWLTNGYFDTLSARTALYFNGGVSTNELLGPTGVSSNAYVNRRQLYNLLDSFAEVTLYGDTNAHPVLTGKGSLSTTNPAAWSVTNSIAASGTNLVGSFAYVVPVDLLREGVYSGRFYAEKAGTRVITAYIELVEVDAANTHTNIIATSGPSTAFATGLSSYIVNCSVTNNVEESAYLAVRYYLVSTGGGGTTTVITRGGGTYATHLSTPGLGTTGSASTVYTSHNAPSIATTTNWTVSFHGGTNLYDLIDVTMTNHIMLLDSTNRPATNYVRFKMLNICNNSGGPLGLSWSSNWHNYSSVVPPIVVTNAFSVTVALRARGTAETNVDISVKASQNW